MPSILIARVTKPERIVAYEDDVTIIYFAVWKDVEVNLSPTTLFTCYRKDKKTDKIYMLSKSNAKKYLEQVAWNTKHGEYGFQNPEKFIRLYDEALGLPPITVYDTSDRRVLH